MSDCRDIGGARSKHQNLTGCVGRAGRVRQQRACDRVGAGAGTVRRGAQAEGVARLLTAPTRDARRCEATRGDARRGRESAVKKGTIKKKNSETLHR